MDGWRLPRLNRPGPKPLVASRRAEDVIPRWIHQTFATQDVPADVRANIEALKALNPGWRYTFYDDAAAAEFIASHYGADILRRYESINPVYGAARADLFRYLLLYSVGGVYLDIKSGATKPFDAVLKADDVFVLSTWPKSAEFAGWGQHAELAALAEGEFQQWFIISAPGHPFLKAVIEAVLRNIDVYLPTLHGVGKPGVLRATGPIAYTLAIAPIIRSHAHRLVRSGEDLGLRYSIYSHASPTEYQKLFKAHYATLMQSIVILKSPRAQVEAVLAYVKRAARFAVRRLRRA